MTRINPWTILLLIIAVVLLVNITSSSTGRNGIAYNAFLELVNQDKVKTVVFTDQNVDIALKQQEEIATVREE